jgi:threonine dehydrogenase-like Zn-dependent dehydrogenase
VPALVYRKSVPRYLLMRAGAKRVAGLETGRLSPLQLEEATDPELPAPDWVRIRPALSGICGSDLSTLAASSSPYFSPMTSPPFVMGHEVVGTVEETNGEWRAGDRVLLEPALGCAVRGISPPCEYCATGRHALCTNVTAGIISPGVQTGFCHDTGGGWTTGTLVVHPSQLHRLPDDLADEAAILLEPFACAVHAVKRTPVASTDTVLVLGAGSVGLLVVAALRRLADPQRIICVAKHERQRREAFRLGADEVVHPKELYDRLPRMLGATRHDPELGKPVILGGADVVFECLGSPGTIEDAIRLARPDAPVTLVGMPGARSTLDLTPLWHGEVSLVGAYAYGTERHEGRELSTFGLAMELAPGLGFETLAGPAFSLDRYPEAIRAARSVGRAGHVKVVFDLRQGQLVG